MIFFERPAQERTGRPIKDAAPPATGRWELPYITMAAEMRNGDLVTQAYGADRRPPGAFCARAMADAPGSHSHTPKRSATMLITTGWG